MLIFLIEEHHRQYTDRKNCVIIMDHYPLIFFTAEVSIKVRKTKEERERKGVKEKYDIQLQPSYYNQCDRIYIFNRKLAKTKPTSS